jgi:hypothetical protein
MALDELDVVGDGDGCRSDERAVLEPVPGVRVDGFEGPDDVDRDPIGMAPREWLVHVHPELEPAPDVDVHRFGRARSERHLENGDFDRRLVRASGDRHQAGCRRRWSARDEADVILGALLESQCRQARDGRSRHDPPAGRFDDPCPIVDQLDDPHGEATLVSHAGVGDAFERIVARLDPGRFVELDVAQGARRGADLLSDGGVGDPIEDPGRSGEHERGHEDEAHDPNRRRPFLVQSPERDREPGHRLLVPCP